MPEREPSVLMLNNLDLSGVNLNQYTDIWAFEENRFWLQWELIQGMNLAQHMAAGQQNAAAKVSEPDRNGIVRIDISGTMMKYGSSFSDAGSTIRIRNEVRRAKNDPNVEAVLFVLDTPGGAVAGTGDLAQDIAELSAVKPTMTFAEDLMASAGLWAGLQARKVYANQENAVIGSMGVFIGLYDYSGAAAQKGIKPVVITTGELKGAGFPGAEITDAQKEMWQSLADSTLAKFKAAVGVRKISKANMEELSKAGVYPASKAIDLGLIDGVRSIDAAVAELRSMIPKKRMTAMSDEKPQAATLEELEKACAGASSDFLLGQMRISATLPLAQGAWMRAQEATIKDLQAQLVTSKQATQDAITAAATAKTGFEATIATLTTEKATLAGQLAARKGTNPLPESFGDGSGGGATSATAAWNQAVEAKVKEGMNRQAACGWVMDNQPDIHKAFLEESNANRKQAKK